MSPSLRKSAGCIVSALSMPSQLKPIECNVLNHGMSFSVRFSCVPTRSRASWMDLRENDTKPILSGGVPLANSVLTISISVCVLPHPGGPKISVSVIRLLAWTRSKPLLNFRA